MTPPALLVSPAQRGRSLRSELLLWQVGTTVLVTLALGLGTLLFTVRYVTTQFTQVRQQQAEALLFNSDLALALQDEQADDTTRDLWMSGWREVAGAALLAGWNVRGQVAFDAVSPELTQLFVDDTGRPRQPRRGAGVVTVDGQPYYWRSEGLIGGQQTVGQAVVAFELPRKSSLLWASLRQQLPLTLVVLALALLAAWWLWRRLRRTLLDLEPGEIASLAVQQGQLLSTVQDRVIVLNALGQVTVANAAAAAALHLTRLPASLGAVWPELAQVSPGEALQRQPLPQGGRVMLVNLTPLPDCTRLVAFSDREEATRLAEQLTDTRHFVEALRARTHEYGNRLHIIAGFLQLGQPGRALRAIQDELDAEAGLGQALSGIAEPRVAALLAGKVARAHELRLTLSVAPESEVPAQLLPDQADALITALGNYIENAFEALGGGEGQEVTVDIGLDPLGLSAEVRDNGPGVPHGFDPFAPAQTTKGAGRGHGLAATAQLARAVGAEVWHERQGQWTVFGLNMPLDLPTAGS